MNGNGKHKLGILPDHGRHANRGPHPFSCATGKACHASRKTAKRHRKTLAGRYGDATHAIYRCRLCSYWHVGHKHKGRHHG